MENINISDLALKTGISKETIRYYRDLGLINPQKQANGYFIYSPLDALVLLHLRELRGNNIAIKDLLSSEDTLFSYSETLDDIENKLSLEIEHLNQELERIKATKSYLARGIHLLENNIVEEFEGKNTWTVEVFDSCGFQKKVTTAWTDVFPFVYTVITVPLEELKNEDAPLKVSVGLGILDKYIRIFGMPLGKMARLHSSGKYIRTCIALSNPICLYKNQFQLLLNYAEEHDLRMTDCIGGRLLFIENTYKKPLFYIMIWAKVRNK